MRSSPASRSACNLGELVERGVIAPSTRNPLPDDVMCHQVKLALARGLPEVGEEAAPHDRTMVIVGSGPSIRELPSARIGPACDIFALGGAHNWLIDHGVVPHAWINADPLPLVAKYVGRPHKDVTYYLASHGHKFVFEALEGHRIVVWNDNVGQATFDEIRRHRKTGIMIAGGSTGATRAPFLGHVLGYRKFTFYGVDCSGDYVADVQRFGDPLTVECGGREYATTIQFAHQALMLRKIFSNPEWQVEVKGQGLGAAAVGSASAR